ncbi:MAG: hypothetical protein A2342_08600 [Gallionellales bacterium RIFOXYB12_FULL_54_9]|nr:MAG: hypothetical protein A2342_08600 [Gallionellales bacterium RIFOXYB12_FULL_54_9]
MNNDRNRQQGVVLVIAMVALLAISLGGVALMRTVDTSNVVSGNVAFNEAAIQMADIGAEVAYAEINAEADPKVFTGKAYYFPNYSPISPTSGLPTQAGAWQDVPANTVNLSGYRVQYMVERMCAETANFQENPTLEKCRASPLNVIPPPDTSGGASGTTGSGTSGGSTPACTSGISQPVTRCTKNNAETICITDTTETICNVDTAQTLVHSTSCTLETGTCSSTVSLPVGSVTTAKLYYRITVQVFGPRNTRALAQYFYPQEIPVN